MVLHERVELLAIHDIVLAEGEQRPLARAQNTIEPSAAEARPRSRAARTGAGAMTIETWELLSYVVTAIGLPLAILVLFSFSASRYATVWSGFTLDWYVKLFSNERIA